MDHSSFLPILELLNAKHIDNFKELSLAGFHQFFLLQADGRRFFVKVGPKEDLKKYEAEKKGLEAIEETKTVRVPHPFVCGLLEDHSYLVLEYIQMMSRSSDHLLGTKLAELHLKRGQKRFGFAVDNTLGPTLQINNWMDDWAQFFIQNRLLLQLKLIQDRYDDVEVVKSGEQLAKSISVYFEGLSVYPSLLHGDLWAGNAGVSQDGEPVIFDPACYYGHHEAELSIMHMFGGFSVALFSAYHTLIPKAPGYDERLALYQLYHYLNHYNIFGQSYRGQCLQILKRFF